MARDIEEEFLHWYREELTWLRRMGARFAKSHPRLARRLDLKSGESQDPHVERLLEGFAFLTARLQHTLAGELPEITHGLLEFLYPHFVQPVPSMAIAQFSPDHGGAGLTTGLQVPAGTQLFVETTFQQRTCRFQTSYPVTLWPLVVEEARFEGPANYPFLGAQVAALLRVRLRSTAGDLRALAPSQLRFHLQGEPGVIGALYELLTCRLQGVMCLPNGQPRADADGESPPKATVRPVGFAPNDAVLPTPPNGLTSYTLLQEYFAFPEKFQFFDVEGLTTAGAGERMDLLFLFDTAPRRRLSVNADNFQLGCTPIINLFDKVSEPLQLDGRQSEHLLVPDARWERTTEIHHIRHVTNSLSLGAESIELEPLYGLGHASREDAVYWHARRRPSRAPETPGTDIYLGFVDAHLRNRLPAQHTVRALLSCTNRDLATHLVPGDPLHIEDGPHARAVCLTRPTPQLSPPMQGEALWRLISHLASSHLGLPEGPLAREALQAQLRLYQFTTIADVDLQVRAIEDVRRDTVARRIDEERGLGFCRVQRLVLQLDEDRFGGLSPLLFGEVIHHYLAAHASINVYTEVVLETRKQGTLKVWPPNIPKMR